MEELLGCVKDFFCLSKVPLKGFTRGDDTCNLAFEKSLSHFREENRFEGARNDKTIVSRPD